MNNYFFQQPQQCIKVKKEFSSDKQSYNSTISNNTLYGLSVDNLSSTSDSIMAINLAGTSFDNDSGGYAIFGAASPGAATTIDYAGASFSGNT